MTSPNMPRDLSERLAESGLFDETLDDRSLEHLPVGELRDELLRQRFVHGLLRAMHTMDAEGREARVQRILETLPARPGRSRRPLLVLAASVLALASVAWFVFPSSRAELPRAEALVARAVVQLGEPVDRHFTILRTDTKANGSNWAKSSLQMTTRPGRFLVEGKSVFGTFRAGLDDKHIWYAPTNPMFAYLRRSYPIKDGELAIPATRSGDAPTARERRRQKRRDRSLRGFERLKAFLDIGYVNLEPLMAKLTKLPATCTLMSTGREMQMIDGETCTIVRIEASGWEKEGKNYLDSAVLWVDEGSGKITRVEILVKRGKGHFVVEYDYHGTVREQDDRYKRPW